MDPITGTLDFVSSVLDNLGSKICQMDFSSYMDANSCSDYFWNSRSYENDLHNSMSITHNNSTSRNPIIDLQILKGASKNPLNASKKIYEKDTSKSSTFINNDISNLSTLDEACPRHCAYDIPNSAFSSYDLDDNNKSVSFSSKDTSSYLDRASEFYNVMSTEIDSILWLPGLWSSRVSLSIGAIRHSIGYAIQYFSQHKARASSHTYSNHLTDSNNAVSSLTTTSVGFSQTPILDLKGL